MLQTYERHGKTKLVTTIVAVLVVAGIVLLADHIKAQSKNEQSTPTQNAAMTSPPSSSGDGSSTPSGSTGTSGSGSSSSSGEFKDGAYEASSEYFVPHSNENIDVNLTLQNGVVTDVSIQNSENDPTSAVFQEDFTSSYKSAVVG